MKLSVAHSVSWKMDPRDAELVQETLSARIGNCLLYNAPLKPSLISIRVNFEQGGFGPDSSRNYTLPSLRRAMSAIEGSPSKTGRFLPFIFVSGNGWGEEVAIEALKFGCDGLCFSRRGLSRNRAPRCKRANYGKLRRRAETSFPRRGGAAAQ